MIYFFKDTGSGHHKIGFTSSKSAKDRLSSCQTGNPNKLTVTGIMPGTQKKEKELHKKYASYNISNEWFSLTEEQVIDIILENNGEVYCEGWEKQKNWNERVEMIKERFSSLSSLLYKGDDSIPLLSDEQIEQLDAQVSRVHNAIKKGMKDNEELVKTTYVEKDTPCYHFDKEEKKHYAIFKMTPTVNINFLLDKPTQEYVDNIVNKKTESTIESYCKIFENVIEQCKKDANKSIVSLLESTEQRLEEKDKEIEALKEQLKNSARKEESLTKENAKKVLEQMLKAL